MARAAAGATAELARLEASSSGIGHEPSKRELNLLAVLSLMRGKRTRNTCGVIGVDPRRRIIDVAAPAGVVLGLLAAAQPAAVAIQLVLCAVQGRNGLCLVPDSRSAQVVAHCTRLLAGAATEAGAPEDLVLCLDEAGEDDLVTLHESPLVAVTVGSRDLALRDRLGRSRKPLLWSRSVTGVVFVHRSAEPVHAARCVIASKTFDHGLLPEAECAVVVDRDVADALRSALVAQGAFFCDSTAEAALRVEAGCDADRRERCEGRSAVSVAHEAGIDVPRTTTLLVVSPGATRGPDGFAYPRRCPLVAWHVVADWRSGRALCGELPAAGEILTVGVHARDQEVIVGFGLESPGVQVIVNAPLALGAIGHATGLAPSLLRLEGHSALAQPESETEPLGAEHFLRRSQIAFPRAEVFGEHGLPLVHADADPGMLFWQAEPEQRGKENVGDADPAPRQAYVYRESEVHRITEEMVLRALLGDASHAPRPRAPEGGRSG